MERLKACVIDLGFNSMKLVKYKINNNSSFDPVFQESANIRLGEGLDGSGNLNKKSIKKTIEFLKYFKNIIKSENIDIVISVATSAVRDAKNKEEFLNQIYIQTGLNFKLLSDEEEAFYSYLGALNSVRIETGLFFDLGGGSLELVYVENSKIQKTISLPLGALRLAIKYPNLHMRHNGLLNKNYLDLENYIQKNLFSSGVISTKFKKEAKLVGIGGTLRSIYYYKQELENNLLYPSNHILDYNSIKFINNKLLSMNSKELSKIKSIGSKRLKSIVAGSSLIEILMRELNFQEVIVSYSGLREGMLISYLEQHKIKNMLLNL